jgi:hypothetical protein
MGGSALALVLAFGCGHGRDDEDRNEIVADDPVLVIPDEPAAVTPDEPEVVVPDQPSDPIVLPHPPEVVVDPPALDPDSVLPELRPLIVVDAFAGLLKFWTIDRFRLDDDTPVRLDPTLATEVLAKAPVDECFTTVGGPYPPVVDQKCEQGIPKRNDAYVWGLAKSGSDIWFGTVANVICQAQSTLIPGGLTMDLGAELNRYFVCEFDEAASGTGDWRRPHIYRYNLDTKVLEDLSLGPAGALLSWTSGIRAAGTIGDVVILGGPAFPIVGINLFAFDVHDGTLLEARNIPEYSDIRSFVAVKGALYTAVGVSEVKLASEPGGFVLRYRGDCEDWLAFETVGILGSEGANLTEHEGRIWVSTWPVNNTVNPLDFRYASVYVSPLVPLTGLTESEANGWTKIWSITDYDPDLITARTTGLGAIASFEGAVYWGTMNVPFISALAASQLDEQGVIDLDTNGDGEIGPVELLSTLLGTHRSASLLRAVTGVGAACVPLTPQIELVYGETFLPKYDPALKTYRIAYDAEHANRMGQEPLWGASGFGNFFNQYVWSAEVFEHRLFLGTFDALQVERAGISGPLAFDTEGIVERPVYEALIEQLGARIPVEGADLMRIDDASGQAFAETLSGLGNNTNYGIRTMVSDCDSLFIGTANAMNLSPRGGWELIEAETDAVAAEPAVTEPVPAP